MGTYKTPNGERRILIEHMGMQHSSINVKGSMHETTGPYGLTMTEFETSIYIDPYEDRFPGTKEIGDLAVRLELLVADEIARKFGILERAAAAPPRAAMTEGEGETP